MKQLITLDMSDTYLSGPIPDGFYDCTNLDTVDLAHYSLSSNGSEFVPEAGYQGLTGTISSRIGNLKKLRVLRLGANSLTGSIPAEITLCTNLDEISINDNLLTGSLPTGIGNLTNLNYLNVTDNNLSGQIPDGFYNLTSLGRAYLSYDTDHMIGSNPIGRPQNSTHNRFTGTLSAKIGNLTQLETLRLEGTYLTGTIPVELLRLDKLNEVSLSYNRFSGTLPKSFGTARWWKASILRQQEGYTLTLAN